MLPIVLVGFFIAGYLLIALEHQVRLNKAATALFLGVGCWIILVAFQGEVATPSIEHHLVDIAGIIFFLMGAMTMVSMMDHYGALEILLRVLKPSSVRLFLFQVSVLAFVFSAVLDNLTTAIVACSLSNKVIRDSHQKIFFGGFIIIAANAGGAWSPIGDVTTTMLWISGDLTALHMMKVLWLPSVVSFLLPLVVALFRLPKEKCEAPRSEKIDTLRSSVALILGVVLLCLVPVAKAWLHLPPAVAMLGALSLYWVSAEFFLRSNRTESHSSVELALQKIDLPSLLFFIGILLAVGALATAGILETSAAWLARHVPSEVLIMSALGVLSAIIDNVPLVAAGIHMYGHHAPDTPLWELLAFCAGTGGSLLIIGSAAGVAVMGIKRISFGAYFRVMTPLALLGFTSGIGAFLLVRPFIN